MIKPSQDIHLSLALKNCAKIITHGCVETSFMSLIKTDSFAVQATSGAVVHIPRVKAKTIKLEVRDDSIIKNQEGKKLTTNFISLVCQDDAHMELRHIKALLLQAEKDGKGVMQLAGHVDEQHLYLKNGSFLAYDLISKIIRPIIRKGEGTIEMTGLEWIEGTVALKTQHDIGYKTYRYALWMTPEEDVLNSYTYLKGSGFAKDEILKYLVWEDWKKNR